eukprot:TRINITY_DN22106_c0_g1_i1.p1 TRINITY_DN22106_c0_g1~~TRINITY_DN22106_c0_g1_i1.p1  ORF type:complete len:219 (+),score=64.39 TRINITY_DN22106_c0_g1_i1:205-861(+)
MRGQPDAISKSFINCSSSDVEEICRELAVHHNKELSLLEHEGGYYFLVCASATGITYIAVGTHSENKTGDLKTLRSFLESMRSKFETAYGAQIRGEAPTSQLVGRGYAEFDRVIKEVGQDAIAKNPRHATEKLVDHVMDVMIENIEKVLERHTKIEIICEDANSLRQESMKFHKVATEAKKRMCWKNYKCWIYIALAALVVLLVILMIACSPDFSKCK